MAVDSNFYKQKQWKGLYYALGFLIIVVLITGWLFFFNNRLASEISDLKEQISQREDSIKDRRKDKNIETYYIYNRNESILEELAEKSQIPTFVEHALRTMVRYDLVFEGFSYSNWQISLNATSESNDKGLAHTKVSKFVNEYNKSESSLFELQWIENFSWQDNIRFPIIFTIK